MPDCPSIATCPFFNDRMANKPATSGIMKKNYCQANFATCARRMVSVALGGPQVPPDLYPNMVDKARSILVAAGKPA